MKKFLFFAAIYLIFLNLLTAQITSPSPYCDGSFDDVDGTFPVGDAVNSVSIGTLTNATNAQWAYPHYVFYNNLTAPTLIKGHTYSLNLAFDVTGGCGYGVWIDFNHNNTFDPSEKVAGSTSGNALNLSSNTVVNNNITIPTTATTGITRMRVRIVEDDTYNMANNYVIAACNASSSSTDIMDWGETEDYNVNITTATGIDQMTALSNEISLYPNPATSILNVGYFSPVALNYKIYNVLGTEVKSGKLDSDHKTVGLNSMNQGIYIIEFSIDNKIVKRINFIKQ